MENLRLENSELILKKLELYASKMNMDSLSLMEILYKTIIDSKESNILYDFCLDLKTSLKNNDILDTKEELFHVISWELNNKYTNLILKDIKPEYINEVNQFLVDNYLQLFTQYYEKYNIISINDYNETILSINKNFGLEKEIGDIILGNWISDIIIKKRD